MSWDSVRGILPLLWCGFTGVDMQNKYDATSAPSSTDDSSSGYSVGSLWIDTTNDDMYVCMDATASAAKWHQIFLSSSDGVVWDDMRIIPSAFDFPGVSDPVIGNWQPGASGTTFKVWVFDQNDCGFFSVQMPHGYKQGTDIMVHVHWTPRDRGTDEGTKTVAWKLDYSWANINGTFGASATVDCTDACTNADDTHLMSPEATIDGHTSSKNISSMLMCKIYRDTGDSWAGTGATQAPALLEVDFHYQIDTVGSMARTSK